MPPPGKVSSSAAEQVVDIDPLIVHFTFSRIRPRFSCGRTIESTLQQFRDGELHPCDLPFLSVLTDGAHYYSQNNRRLYAYKQLRREGVLATIPVRLRPIPQTKRMQHKYSQEACALSATLMRDTVHREALCDSPSASSSGAPALPARCAAEPRSQREGVEGRQSGEASREGKREGKQQERVSTPPRQQQQQLSSSRCGNASRRLRRLKGAAARPPSSCSSDSGSNGGASALEAELRKLGLQT
ncbi:hypothetical protein LSCM1_06432 [Leishmania martiniquensis]|uniref:Uncharacterized protein n=1 Tax=Leishmania martiniquensis TaxID=1580590 RepID=A0A836GDJ3_9TRYP|nr:hypothetical protein LSCM1_06432 [Leishmania martiniquensis]